MSASAPTLVLQLCESPRLSAVEWLLRAVALASVLALPVPAAVRALLGAALLLACLSSWRRRRPAARRLELAADGRCTIFDAAGTALEGTLGAGSLALPGLVVLELEQPGGRRGLWLASDAFRGEGLRRLRVRLRAA